MTDYDRLLEVSTDMGMKTLKVSSPTGPADALGVAKKMAEKVCSVGFWIEDTFYPANRVNYAKVIKDEE